MRLLRIACTLQCNMMQIYVQIEDLLISIGFPMCLLVACVSTEFMEQISSLESKLQNLMTSISQEGAHVAGRFEWVDGSLCQAMLHGSWVLLDNANLCNPTVLDRLNAVLEPNGTLYLNECGSVDGKPRVIKPHPNFRLFLAYNPVHGEISRAMRNRSIEVFLMPLVCF